MSSRTQAALATRACSSFYATVGPAMACCQWTSLHSWCRVALLTTRHRLVDRHVSSYSLQPRVHF